MEYLTENNIAVGLRMRQIRRSHQMTQEKLADTLGVSVNYLGEVERGRKPLSRSLADQFCQYFCVSYDYLYYGTNPPSPSQLRERAVYQATDHPILNQVRDCSPEEIYVISHLIDSYLDITRQLSHYPSKKSPRREHHTQNKHFIPQCFLDES
jgi:transcriptional regulator with XRE-family HTH domain